MLHLGRPEQTRSAKLCKIWTIWTTCTQHELHKYQRGRCDWLPDKQTIPGDRVETEWSDLELESHRFSFQSTAHPRSFKNHKTQTPDSRGCTPWFAGLCSLVKVTVNTFEAGFHEGRQFYRTRLEVRYQVVHSDLTTDFARTNAVCIALQKKNWNNSNSDTRHTCKAGFKVGRQLQRTRLGEEYQCRSCNLTTDFSRAYAVSIPKCNKN